MAKDIRTTKYTLEEFIKKVNQLFPDNFTFEKTVYNGNKNPLIITCKKHGDITITPSMLFKGYGCWECEKRKHFMSYDEFTTICRERYGDKYNITTEQFSNKDKNGKIEINCPLHGVFHQKIDAFLKGYHCKKCREKEKINKKNRQLNDKIKELYGNGYDATIDEHDKRKVEINCYLHGKFTLWKQHVFDKKYICPVCMKNNSNDGNRVSFLKKAKRLHEDKYDYSKVNYINSSTKVCLTCPSHGDFYVTPNDHLNKLSGCPKCSHNISIDEKSLSEFIASLGYDITCNDRNILDNKEIDILIPSKHMAVEYDGLRWHSELYKDKPSIYHLQKTNECADKGIRLLHIFEDEWTEKSQIIKSMIKNILGMTPKKIYARQCKICDVDSKTSMRFLDENHIQGRCKAKYHYGLYHNGELVSLMTFGKTRQQRKHNENYDDTWELLRFCNRLNTTVIGGASKLLKHFINEVKPKRILSYSDKRWSTGNLYKKLGFTHTHDSKPNYFYVINHHRENRFKYRKGELVRQGYDPSKSEHEIMLERGIPRIYDCGTMAFEMIIE